MLMSSSGTGPSRRRTGCRGRPVRPAAPGRPILDLTPWPSPPPASSASPAAPSPRNGPAAARPAASGTPSPRKPIAAARRPGAAKPPPAASSTSSAWPAPPTPPPRTPIGIAELDRVLGGGLVPGLGGAGRRRSRHRQIHPAAAGRRRRWRRAGRRVLYVSGEEAIEQVRLRARRLGLARRADGTRRLDQPARHRRQPGARAPTPRWWSSTRIQTMWLDSIDSAPGTVAPGARRRLRADPAGQGARLRARRWSATSPRKAPSPGRACWSTWSTRCSISKATAATSSASCAR